MNKRKLDMKNKELAKKIYNYADLYGRLNPKNAIKKAKAKAEDEAETTK